MLAPQGVRSIRLCRYSGVNAHPALTLTHQRLLSQAVILRKLTRELNHLPRPPHGAAACPNDDGSEILAELGYASDHEVRISIRLTGCTGATNGSVSRRATQRLIAQLERLANKG
jgi:hypothetical protein